MPKSTFVAPGTVTNDDIAAICLWKRHSSGKLNGRREKKEELELVNENGNELGCKLTASCAYTAKHTTTDKISAEGHRFNKAYRLGRGILVGLINNNF